MSARFDEENVLRMLQEDDAMQRRAFGMIVEEFGQQLYWQIRRLVLNHDDANDVLQNVYIKAWNGLDTFHGDSRLFTWLSRIAINESLDFVRRQKTMNAIAMAYIHTNRYQEAIPWINRQDTLFIAAEKHPSRDTIFIDEMKAVINYSKALLAHAQGDIAISAQAYSPSGP